MGGVLGAVFQRPHGFDKGIVNGARCPGARLVVQPVHAPLHKTPPPLAHGLPVQLQLGRHLRVLTSCSAGQHNLGSQSQCLRRLPPRRQRLQLGTLLIAQCQGGQLLDRH